MIKKHYPWILFDADGTLFDYDRAERSAFQGAFQALQLPFQEGYLDVYQGINRQLWLALERGEIAPDVLRVKRFELTLDALQLEGSADRLSTVYTEQLSRQAYLMDGAFDVVRTLQATSRLAIVTNGLRMVQRSRFARSAIRDYISELIISEEVGAAKPDPAFFEAAFARLGHPPKRDALLIGDSLSADIQGSLDYGLDACWYNPSGAPRPDGLPITYEIAHLSELLDVTG